MGLDMYLLRKQNGKWVEAAYWRKANQIREWMRGELGEDEHGVVKGEVTQEMLEKLVDRCEHVLEKRSAKYSKLVLPTSEGFFFGPTDYGEYYYQTIKETIDQGYELLDNVNWNIETIMYTESW